MLKALLACVPLERPLGVAVRDAAVARLCDAERIRVNRKVRLEDAVRGASGVFLLRTCAGLSLGATVPRSHRGRPLLRKVVPLQDANVSHHGDWAVCASTNGSKARIGVDVVDLRLLPLRSSLPAFARYLSSGEAARLDPMSDSAEFQVSFGLVWTLKEAFVKAIGRGLTSQLACVEFQVSSADAVSTSLDAVVGPAEAAAAWAKADRLTAVPAAANVESTIPLKPFLQPLAVDLRSGRRLENWRFACVRIDESHLASIAIWEPLALAPPSDATPISSLQALAATAGTATSAHSASAAVPSSSPSSPSASSDLPVPLPLPWYEVPDPPLAASRSPSPPMGRDAAGSSGSGAAATPGVATPASGGAASAPHSSGGAAPLRADAAGEGSSSSTSGSGGGGGSAGGGMEIEAVVLSLRQLLERSP